MKQVDDILDKDPIGLRQYDKGAGGQFDYRHMYYALGAAVVCLILTIVFWFFSLLAGGSAPVASSNVQATTELFYDTRNVAKTLDQLQVGLRLMPSQNTEGNMILMEWTDRDNAQDK